MLASFCEDFQNLYDRDNVNEQLKEVFDNFSIDGEIDVYRQDKRYKENFTIRKSLEDFEEYYDRLKDLSKNFIGKYNELVGEKFMENEMEREMN